ncbi:hypothetical protein K1T71_004635 [Dendrolimus kikuchii]|uniref:Uncharacterized protein n=1 Tax=Dendrolimus kikuchii TaxID=765133 RepID=A0ACC1D7Z0_9NEOP|nr:hypothetical protein K1T71_004635 [Dendrolimus kikuchii]
MKVDIQKNEIESIYRLGRKMENTDNIRPVVVTLTTVGRKIEILRKKKFLKDTNVHLKEDYLKKVVEKRRELQEELKTQQELGKTLFLSMIK